MNTDGHVGVVDEREAVRAIVTIAAHRARYGYGPSWRQLARVLEWPARSTSDVQLARRMRGLRHYGVVWTRQPHSLDVTREAKRWALATLSRARAARYGELA